MFNTSLCYVFLWRELLLCGLMEEIVVMCSYGGNCCYVFLWRKLSRRLRIVIELTFTSLTFGIIRPCFIIKGR